METLSKAGTFLVDAKGFSVWQPAGAAAKAAPKAAKGKNQKAPAPAAAGGAGGEEQKTSRVRYDRLREIEVEMQGIWAKSPQDYNQADAPAKYTQEDKNKYLVTFPYPYMNGYLHLGHGFSLSKAEFQVRYQKQRGKNALFPQGFHCTGMPIQAAANRLKMEITSGKTRSEQPKKAPAPVAPKVEEKKGGKGGKGGEKKPA
jgi:hypothetical protein